MKSPRYVFSMKLPEYGYIGSRVTRIICVYSRKWGFLIGTSLQFLNVNPASGAAFRGSTTLAARLGCWIC